MSFGPSRRILQDINDIRKFYNNHSQKTKYVMLLLALYWSNIYDVMLLLNKHHNYHAWQASGQIGVMLT